MLKFLFWNIENRFNRNTDKSLEKLEPQYPEMSIYHSSKKKNKTIFGGLER